MMCDGWTDGWMEIPRWWIEHISCWSLFISRWASACNFLSFSLSLSFLALYAYSCRLGRQFQACRRAVGARLGVGVVLRRFGCFSFFFCQPTVFRSLVFLNLVSFLSHFRQHLPHHGRLHEKLRLDTMTGTKRPSWIFLRYFSLTYATYSIPSCFPYSFLYGEHAIECLSHPSPWWCWFAAARDSLAIRNGVGPERQKRLSCMTMMNVWMRWLHSGGLGVDFRGVHIDFMIDLSFCSIYITVVAS